MYASGILGAAAALIYSAEDFNPQALAHTCACMSAAALTHSAEDFNAAARPGGEAPGAPQRR